MGRKPGVAAQETRASLLDAAAKVFARRGYDAASISDISSEAGLTSGAIYAHYASKADLFRAVMDTHVERHLDDLLGDIDVADGQVAIGGALDQRPPADASLLVTALVAARNDDEVARQLSAQLAERERLFKTLVAEGQSGGALDVDASAEAIARMCLMLSLGSLVVSTLDLEIDESALQSKMGPWVRVRFNS